MSNHALIYDYNYQTKNLLIDIFPQTNYLLYLCGQQQLPILHFWQSYPVVILGLKDKHLSNLNKGLQVLHDNHYLAFIRNSGGLAVISDPGILNVSYFIPRTSELTITQAYQQVFNGLQRAFKELKLEHYQIEHSYCPGEYDLVVQGKKIGGMAQRRQQKAIVVMIYLSVTGNQLARGQLLQQFYEAANTNYQTDYPQVWPDTMANLINFLPNKITINDCKKQLLQVLKHDTINLQILTAEKLAQQKDFSQIMAQEKEKQQQLNQIINKEHY